MPSTRCDSCTVRWSLQVSMLRRLEFIWLSCKTEDFSSKHHRKRKFTQIYFTHSLSDMPANGKTHSVVCTVLLPLKATFNSFVVLLVKSNQVCI
jgi:hypothetical protein